MMLTVNLRRGCQSRPMQSPGCLRRSGTVKLTKAARFSTLRPGARARSAGARHRIPFDERPGSQQPVVHSSQ